MFDIGPMDLLVLVIVGILVFGPERLPGVARDAARTIRSLRELLLGTRTQLREQLGPDLAAFAGTDPDLRKALARLLAEDASPEPAHGPGSGPRPTPDADRPRPRPAA